MNKNAERKAAIDMLVEEYRQELVRLLPDATSTFDQIENFAGMIGSEVTKAVRRSFTPSDAAKNTEPPLMDEEVPLPRTGEESM